MIQITWVEILLAAWIVATLAFSIGFCLLRYKSLPYSRAPEPTNLSGR